jgi:glucokinase
MILAGDVGGTKTVLALYEKDRSASDGAVREIRFENANYRSLEAVISEFLRETNSSPDAAFLGVAGPVKKQQAQVTNLPWVVSAEAIRSAFGLSKVLLLNDLESTAHAVPYLGRDDLCTLNEGSTDPHGNIVVIAPGTGLGIAFLVWTGERYKAFASEGGHTSFSPRDPRQMELLQFLDHRYGHVSFERICSGGQLPNVYDFLLEKGRYPEPAWLREELAHAPDRTPIIVRAALERKANICEAAVDLFVHVLGTAIGNMAVTLLPTGGIYLGGGIPPRILNRLQKPDFLFAIADKGRFRSLCDSMPVHVILNTNAALQGAAGFGLKTLAQPSH